MQPHPFPHLLPSVSSFSSHQKPHKEERFTYCVWGGAAAGSGSVGKSRRRARQAGSWPSGLPGVQETGPSRPGCPQCPPPFPQPLHCHHAPLPVLPAPPPLLWPTSQLQPESAALPALGLPPTPSSSRSPLSPNMQEVPASLVPSLSQMTGSKAQKLPFNTSLIMAFPPPGPRTLQSSGRLLL